MEDLPINAMHYPFDALIDKGPLRPLLESRNVLHLSWQQVYWRVSPQLYRDCAGCSIILVLMILNSRILLAAGPYEFTGKLELETAPNSVAWLVSQFPLKGAVQHASWSGEAGWLPLSGAPQLAPEGATANPPPGQILLYAGILSQAELLIPYGTCSFASKAGSLAGSPVIALDGPLENLRALGRLLILKGMQSLKLDWLPEERP